MTTTWEEPLRDEWITAVRTALEFDFFANRGASPDSVAGLVNEHITSIFEDRLLVERRVTTDLVQNLIVGETCVLVGEAGAGKTAIVHDLRRRLEKISSQEDSISSYHLIILNCNRYTATLIRNAESGVDHILLKLAEELESVADAIDQSDESFDWRFELMLASPNFEDFRLFHPVTSASRLHDLLKTDSKAQANWSRSFDRHLVADPRTKVALVLEVLLALNRRIVIALDNVDQLDPGLVREAADAAHAISQTTESPIGVLLAIRPGTMGLVRDRLSFAPSQFYLNLDFGLDRNGSPTESERLTHDLQQIREMIERRIGIFENDELLLNKLRFYVENRYGATVSSRDLARVLRPSVGKLRRLMMTTIDDYFAPTTRPDRTDLTTFFVGWHNNSIREMSGSLYAYARSFMEPAWLGSTEGAVRISEPPTRMRDARTALIRHILFHNTNTEIRNGYPSLHPAFDIFRVQDDGPAGQSFVFLRMRLLQYLVNRSQATTRVGKVRRDFRVFGVNGERIGEELRALAHREGYVSGLVRLDGVADGDGEFSDDLEVELLPAGHLLVSRLAKTVEFLFWHAVTDERARADISQKLDLRPRRLVEEETFNSEVMRVRVALAFVNDVLIPRFRNDHPYLATTAPVQKKDAQRLKDFAQLFGFSVDRWFITQASQDINNFVRLASPAIDLDRDSDRRRASINIVSQRLDTVIKTEFGSVPS